MKRKLALVLAVLMLLSLLAPVASANTTVVITPPAGVITHPAGGIFLTQGAAAQLSVNVPVIWMTSAPTVAHIDQSGVVSGVSVGQAVISALPLDGSPGATITVDVTGPAGLVQLNFWWGHGAQVISTPASTYQAAMNQIETSAIFRPQFNHMLGGWFRSAPEASVNNTARSGEILPTDALTQTSYRFLHALWVPAHTIGTVASLFPDPSFQAVVVGALTQTYGGGIDSNTPVTATDLQFIRTSLDFSHGFGATVTDLSGAHLLSGVTGFHNLTGQERILDPVGPSDRIVHRIQARNGFGGDVNVMPSHGGVVEGNTIIWENLPRNVEEVHYDFSQNISLGGRSVPFSGRVVLPIREGYPPSAGQDPLPFTDVPQSSAFYSAVRHVFENGIMLGTSDTTFQPHLNLDRSMVATILWRLEGEPARTFRPIFPDVVGGQWYSTAITWAYDEGIVRGIGDGRFAPVSAIAREELAGMMFRLAQSRGLDMNISETVMVNNVSSWAEEYVRWAVYHGFMTGQNWRIPATRAETAVFVYRFDNAFGN